MAAIALAAMLPVTIAACGGGSSSSNVDPNKVLHETFSNPKSISSGKLDLSLGIFRRGGPFIGGPARGRKRSQRHLKRGCMPAFEDAQADRGPPLIRNQGKRVQQY